MKKIINVNVKVSQSDASKLKTDLLAVGLFSDVKKLDKLCAKLDGKLGGAISKILKLGDFKAKESETAVLYTHGAIGAERIMLCGLGDRKKANSDTARKAAAAGANKAVQMGLKNMAMALHVPFAEVLDISKAGKALAEGAYFGSYRYDEFVTGDDKNGRAKSLGISVIDSSLAVIKKLKKPVAAGVVIGRSQSFARTIANRPGNVINPAAMASQARALAKNNPRLTCTVFDEKQLKAKGMGGILAVGAGSVSKPRLIILKYNPQAKSAAKLPTVALVGKAVTFDSGGISIKPAANMDHMKLDKTGGVSVLATMKAVAELKLAVNVYGIIPSAENAVGGNSYRPGDIVKTFSGKTVEVLNTDAEGRMILCDAMAYAAKQKCDVIIDVATLTGACMVALGTHMAGLMGNDDELIEKLKTASVDSGEKVWHLPSGEEYANDMKSKIADLRNIGGRWGGACTAAAFLSQFIGDAKWAHLDIAGMDLFEKPSGVSTVGSTGFGVRLLSTYLMNLIETKG